MVNLSAELLDDTKQALLAAIVASSDDAIISKTLQGIITSWNPAAERLLGYSEEEAVGKHISMIIPGDRAQEEDYIIREIAGGNKVEHFETVRRTKHGQLIPLSLTISPVRDQRGMVIGASKIARDISERLALQREREQLYRKAKFLNKRKDKLIAMAAHELKTPLTSLNGFLQMLEQEIGTDHRGYFLIERSLKQIKKLGSLIGDLLDVSRIRDGKVPLNLERFEITALLKEVLMNYQHLSGHRFEFNTEAPVYIYGDRLRLEQVFSNIISNAVKYSPNGGNIEVAVTENTEDTLIYIRDEGIGISDEHIGEIFTQFYRVAEPGDPIPGFGLGLFISKEIIERHGGIISVKSSKGIGSTFIIKLPRS
ncbi:PAS domain S-box protein [Niabella pedocola]|uniref:histidine kinase n=1 Tax=Niabella pedocola TaxID=1752077 RepID=A0ABS8PMW5_9BACT|nr:PAS domain S-box protein [Niabella pedocola]MCD2422089.1 PAS domain S-box protein [Niabella pedocola]